MKISQEIISNLKKGGVDFYLSVPCKLLANMITVLEADSDIYYSAIPREEEGMGICAGAYVGAKWGLSLINVDVADIDHWNRGKGKCGIRFTENG